MRVLAARLGAGPMTLYGHVASREELDVLVVEAVLSQASWSREPHADWRQEVREIALASWRAVRAHPHAIPLILTRRTRSPAALEAGEALLAALARGGLGGRRLLHAFRAITAFVTGFAQAELAGPLAANAGQTAAETIERVRALGDERFAQLVALADQAATSDPESEFLGGLDILIAGMAAFAEVDRR
ncbi:MAG TPA: TetR/AcrR family transcriptional regulator C-terminal domain-containing protein [Candidatus Binatia bacterium]|nr:TetR/AcrR family transcriptional regulator C-terminal domain-containing protein [Candidatus Binatia bacterium]